MQVRAWRRIRGEAVRLAERDREVAALERRVRNEEEAVARGAHRVLSDDERGHPLHGCGGAVAVREKGQGGGRGGWAGEGQAAPGGGAGSRGSRGGAEVCQPRPRADADGLGLGVATAAAVCAAAGTDGARDGRGPDGEGRGGAGPLREVGGENEGTAGEAGDPPLQQPGRQGREARGEGA